MRNLEEDYRRYAAIEKKLMEDGNTKEAEEEARKEYQELLEEVRAEGKQYGKLMRLYTEMKKKENLTIVLDGSYDDILDTLLAFKEYGISKFVFASGWTDAMEQLWKIQSAGAINLGMVEVNESKDYSFTTKQYEYRKVHGFLFQI